jgi:hypothetical protein
MHLISIGITTERAYICSSQGLQSPEGHDKRLVSCLNLKLNNCLNACTVLCRYFYYMRYSLGGDGFSLEQEFFRGMIPQRIIN